MSADLIVIGFWLKKLIAELVLPPAGPMIGMAIGLLLLRRRRSFGAFLIGSSMTALFVLSLPIVANALAAHDERLYPPLDPTIALPPHAAIVVLGGGVQFGATDYGGETVNPTTLARLRSAARLASRIDLPILVTGGRLPDQRHAEGELMADALRRDFHVTARWIEQGALDTADNASLSAPMLKSSGFDTAVLVTDVSHMRRAQSAFEAAGIAVIPAPTDYYADARLSLFSFLPSASALHRVNWTLHEWLGMAWMQLIR
jgi:uncharacterized SAM-binding protein YcdF (DUF218 family)